MKSPPLQVSMKGLMKGLMKGSVGGLNSSEDLVKPLLNGQFKARKYQVKHQWQLVVRDLLQCIFSVGEVLVKEVVIE